MLRVRLEQRDRLSKPHGKLYTGKGVEVIRKIEELKNAGFVATIGDLVSLFSFQAGIYPDLVVIDFKTERRALEEKLTSKLLKYLSNYRIVRVENPQGHITEELVNALIEGIRAGRTCIIVDGEEDMSALPLSLLLSDGSVVLYGVPSRGIAVYVVNRDDKLLISRIIKEMEEVGESKVKKMLIGGEEYGAFD